MTEKEKISLSKFMSRILRHQPDLVGITLDKHGWADVQNLIDGMNRVGRRIMLDDIKEIVVTDEKQRYRFTDDFSKIRASQGHSVPIDLELVELQPPDILYHGTAERFTGSIRRDGLTSQKRQYVHLSADVETAIKVGRRHGKPVVLTIDASGMHRDGLPFYLSDNNVWLTLAVPINYIKNLK